MVDYESFLEWAKGYFGEENITFTKGGNEICVPSPFIEDFKRHLWMNPSGGKSKHPENGSYRCWKSDKRGSLVSLVAYLEHLDWDEAQAMICDQSSLRGLEKRVHELFGHKVETPQTQQSNVGLIQLPPFTYLISSLREGERYEILAKDYLANRKIPFEGLYVCTSGKYEDRIIIPYYDRSGNLIWWNARSMYKDEYLEKYGIQKYNKPDVPEDSGLSQNNVLYVKRWPRPKQRILVMEGEFDAMTVLMCGHFSAACGGKSLSDSQIDMIRDYIPVLSFDTDTSGKRALIEIGQQLLGQGFPEVYYVRAPKQYKDWNKFLQVHNEETVRNYIEKYTKRFTTWSIQQLQMQDL